MGNLCRSVVLVVSSVVLAGGAHAAEAPLLVAVEVAPGVDVAPADVRQAVASELGRSVAGSRDPVTTEDVLVVWVDGREIRMSLRARAAPIVSRLIAAPADRLGRLRSIGWLAGNLVRDQVGPIVATRDAVQPAAEVGPATEPPALSDVPSHGAVPEVIAAAPASRPESSDSRWMITAAGGPTLQMLFWDSELPDTLRSGAVYQIEAQHQATPDSMLVGAALELGPVGQGATPHYLGFAGFIGSRWRSHRWFMEGTVGLGVEAIGGRYATLSVTNNSQTGTVSESVVSYRAVPGLYARLQGTGGVQVSRMFELGVQLGAHLSSNWEFGSYVASTVGLRARLP